MPSGGMMIFRMFVGRLLARSRRNMTAAPDSSVTTIDATWPTENEFWNIRTHSFAASSAVGSTALAKQPSHHLSYLFCAVVANAAIPEGTRFAALGEHVGPDLHDRLAD